MDTTNKPGGTQPITFDQRCSVLRSSVKSVGVNLLSFIKGPSYPYLENSDSVEMVANLKLAYRHLEDVSMRLGKAIQAYEGGTSIYDQNDAQRVAASGPIGATTTDVDPSSTSDKIGE